MTALTWDSLLPTPQPQDFTPEDSGVCLALLCAKLPLQTVPVEFLAEKEFVNGMNTQDCLKLMRSAIRRGIVVREGGAYLTAISPLQACSLLEDLRQNFPEEVAWMEAKVKVLAEARTLN